MYVYKLRVELYIYQQGWESAEILKSIITNFKSIDN